MKETFLVIVVVIMHVAALGAIVMIQGCGMTQKVGEVENPPSPVMPPISTAEAPRVKTPFKPPIEVKPIVSSKDIFTYTIKKGDSLSSIASKYNINAREIAAINSIKDVNRIQVGQELVIPTVKGITPKTHPKTPRKLSKSYPAKAGASANAYVVQSGDNLTEIANLHGTSIKAIKSINNLSSDKILIGQKIIIPDNATKQRLQKTEPSSSSPKKQDSEPLDTLFAAPSPSLPRPESKSKPTKENTPALPEPMPRNEIDVMDETGTDTSLDLDDVQQDKPYPYRVGEGETLADIARAFVVSENDIIKLNKLTPGEPLKPGQEIMIPASDF